MDGRPVAIVEPFGPGGGVDVLARAFGPRLEEALGAAVVVENVPGEGATAAPRHVAAAAPDGHTLLLNTSAHAYSAVFGHQLGYDPLADFVPVAPVTSQAYVVVAPSSRAPRSLGDLAATAGPLRFVSAGAGTGTHVGVLLLNACLGIAAEHVPPHASDAIAATIARAAAGEVDYAMSPIPIAQPHLDDGTVVALGVTAGRRSPLLPDVPTLAEAGATGFDFPVWYGIWAPVGTSAGRVEELATAVGEALASPAFATWAAAHGAEPMSMTQSRFAVFVADEVERARTVAE